MSSHSSSRIVIALALVLVALFAVSAGPAVPVGEAAKDGSISITSDKHTVNAGDSVTLHIRLHHVTDATLDGEAITGSKIDMRVLVCQTRTYTLTAKTAGGVDLTRKLTITAKGVAGDVTTKPCQLIIRDPLTTPPDNTTTDGSNDPGAP